MTGRTRGLVIIAVLAALIATGTVWANPSSVSAAQPEPQLILGVQAQAEAGETVAISAYLVDPAGNPIASEEITFTIESTFLNVDGQMAIGSATTDFNGLALLPYAPRIEGERVITARFQGNDVFEPTRSSESILVTSGPQLYEEFSPLRIPGANIWMAAGVLTVVWAVFLFICALIWRIAFLGVRSRTAEIASESGLSDE